jgi:hypothetical protein
MPTDTLVGRTYSHWRIVADAPAERDGKRRVEVSCETCGASRVMRLSKLRSGGYSPCNHGARLPPFGRVTP